LVIILKTASRPNSFKENHKSMKKLLVFALGLGIALGTVSFSFAQDTTATKKEKKTKKKKADTTDAKK